MAFSFLQDLSGGVGGLGDGSDYNLSSDSSPILSSLENIGVNFLGGAAGVGVAALGQAAGVSPLQVAQAGLATRYSSGLLTRAPGSGVLGSALGVSPNTLIIGGILVFGLLAFAWVARGKRA